MLTRYLRAVDRGDIATLRAGYLDGATEEHGGLYSGPAQAYVDTIEAELTHPRSVAVRTLTNLLIDVDGDRALSEHYVLALTPATTDGVISDWMVASRIVDDLERHDGRWGIARRPLRFDRAPDTDRMAIEARAKYAVDPVRWERGMAKVFHSGRLSTER